MNVCDAHLRWGALLIDCHLRARHDGFHVGYLYKTRVEWDENDRRTYHGDDPGPCDHAGCPLPLGHVRDHA